MTIDSIPNLDPYLAEYLASLGPAPDEPKKPKAKKPRVNVPYLRLATYNGELVR